MGPSLGDVAAAIAGTPSLAPGFAVEGETPRDHAFDGLFDEGAKLGVGADRSAGFEVEGAFLSGIALAGRVLGLPHEEALEP